MADIVEQLRNKSRKMARIDRAEIPDNEGYKPEDYLWLAAADEIERLRDSLSDIARAALKESEG